MPKERTVIEKPKKLKRYKESDRVAALKMLRHPGGELRSGKQETRSYKATSLSVRKTADGAMQLVGTAIVFDSPSQDMGGFTEIVRYQAVQRSLQRNADVFMLWQHDTTQPLARTTTGTLTLTLTRAGLDFVATLPNSPLGQNSYQAIADKTVDSVSFGFVVNRDNNGDTWTTDAEGNVVRELLDISIREISPVTWAAYEAPHVDVRSAPADIRAKLNRDIDDDDDEEDNPDDLDCDGVDADSEECEDRCDCRCEQCAEGNCDGCSAVDCHDDNCAECPMQTRAAHAALLLRRLR